MLFSILRFFISSKRYFYFINLYFPQAVYVLLPRTTNTISKLCLTHAFNSRCSISPCHHIIPKNSSVLDQ